MAGHSQHQSFDYFSLSKQRTESSASSNPSFIWDSNPYNESAIVSDSCESILTSPTSPESIVFNSCRDTKKENTQDQVFDFGTFEDWMKWDDPSDAALSPTGDFLPALKTEPLSPNMGGLADDTAVFVEDTTITEEPLFQTPTSLITPPLVDNIPRESLYSTPLSWSRPQPGPRSFLTQQEEAKLREIAMPPSKQQYPASPDSASSPEPAQKKRKSSIEEDFEEEESPRRRLPVKKTAHNMIEKRYRTNLNDKIAALRDSVPSLRVMSKRGSQGEDYEEDLQGLTPAHKLNKATVLSKATEYISHLEKRNRHLQKENANLKSRVDAFEILVMSRQQPNARPSPVNRNSRQYSMDGMM